MYGKYSSKITYQRLEFETSNQGEATLHQYFLVINDTGLYISYVLYITRKNNIQSKSGAR